MTTTPRTLKENNISVEEAARMIGKSHQFVRVGLQRGLLPFGTAIKMSTQYSYHISPKLLKEYIGDIEQEDQAI